LADVDTVKNLLSIAISPNNTDFWDAESFVIPLEKYENVEWAELKDGLLSILLKKPESSEQFKKVEIKQK
jgi:HSP20 family molecular chaperone IbpA